MKKIGGMLLSLVLAFALGMHVVSAASYTSLNLEGALKEEELEYDLSSYKESDDQAIIYLFRGNGCGYCRRFLTFLNSIVPEYGKYFKVVSYEVWYDTDNKNLMNDVADFLDKDASGVPFIIIGDKVFEGYASDYDDDIKKAIKDLYNSSDRYDVFQEMEKASNKNEKSETTSSAAVIIWNIVFVVAATVIIVSFDAYRFSKIEEQIASLKSERKAK